MEYMYSVSLHHHLRALPLPPMAWMAASRLLRKRTVARIFSWSDPGEWTVDSCVFMDSKRIRHQSCPKAVKKYPLHIMESQGLTKMRFSSKKTDRIGWCFFLRGKPLHLLINTMVNGCQFPLDFALHQSIEIWFNGVSWVEHSPL